MRLNKGELISLITQIQATISLTTTMESFSFFPAIGVSGSAYAHLK